MGLKKPIWAQKLEGSGIIQEIPGKFKRILAKIRRKLAFFEESGRIQKNPERFGAWA